MTTQYDDNERRRLLSDALGSAALHLLKHEGLFAELGVTILVHSADLRSGSTVITSTIPDHVLVRALLGDVVADDILGELRESGRPIDDAGLLAVEDAHKLEELRRAPGVRRG